MIITITNPITKYEAKFYQAQDWREKYRRCDYVKPAVEDNAYVIMRDGGLSGLFELPHNNSVRNAGIDQDGSNQLNNYYSDRNINFTFKQVLSSNLVNLTNVFYQNDHLLDVMIEHEGRKFYTRGSLNGTYDGVIDMDCDVWFRTGVSKDIEHTVLFNTGTKNFFPFQVNSVYFTTDGIDYSKFTVNTYFQVEPKITLKGHITDLKLENLSDNSFVSIDGDYKEVVIDSFNNDIFADGDSVIDIMKGILPTLYAGDTNFKVRVREFIGDIDISVEYTEIVGCVF